MLGFNVFAADTDEEAELLATSMQQAFVNLRSGTPGQLPAAACRAIVRALSPAERAMLDQVLSCSAIGGPDKVQAAIEAFVAETGADELMITCSDVRSPGAAALVRDRGRADRRLIDRPVRHAGAQIESPACAAALLLPTSAPIIE